MYSLVIEKLTIENMVFVEQCLELLQASTLAEAVELCDLITR